MVEINHQQPSTTINNHQQPSSTIINHHEPMFGGFFGTIKIDPYPSEADPRHRQAIGKSRLWDLLLQRTSNLRCHVFLVLLQVSLANQMVSHATTEITQNHGNVFFAKDDFQKNSYTGWPINPINETRFIQILITYQSWSISLLTPCLQRELHWCEARSLAAGMGISRYGYPKSSKSLDHNFILKPMVTFGIPHDLRHLHIFLIFLVHSQSFMAQCGILLAWIHNSSISYQFDPICGSFLWIPPLGIIFAYSCHSPLLWQENKQGHQY